MPTSIASIEKLIAEGENERVEFKAGVPDPRTIARNLGALTNASGGHIIFGVADGAPQSAMVRGVDVPRVRQAIERAIRMLAPPPAVDVSTVPINGKYLVVATVDRSSVVPVLADGVAYFRQGSASVLATERQLVSRAEGDQGHAQLLMRLEQFGQAIEQQGKRIEELVAGSGFASKLVWMLVGAVVGALLGVIPTIFFG